jgi:hypothetical protein
VSIATIRSTGQGAGNFYAITSNNTASSPSTFQLRRKLKLTQPIRYGIVIIQPTAPMPIFGVVSQEARGHFVARVLLAMIAMSLTPTATVGWLACTKAVRRAKLLGNPHFTTDTKLHS